jgi:RNA polymerase sigma factor (TIGR02999 family)
MSRTPTGDLTKVLRAWHDGDPGAFAELSSIIYDELRGLAHRYRRRQRAGDTLQTTALVHEACVRLMGAHEVDWQDRGHFLAVTAQVMRNVLVDAARARSYQKRGSGAVPVELSDDIPAREASRQVLALNDALDHLAAIDPRKSRVVEMRFFGGFSVEEIASALTVSSQTVMRDWRLAKAWLAREMRTGGGNEA